MESGEPDFRGTPGSEGGWREPRLMADFIMVGRSGSGEVVISSGSDDVPPRDG